jgi:mRNA deadenylase 3'-5' endonuclease subunit Ccr4
MRFCTWNVKSLYRLGFLTAAARELAGYKLNLVGVQEVSGDSKDGFYKDLEHVFVHFLKYHMKII